MDESAVAKEILTWLQVSREFVSEQAPLLAQEILTWGLYSYTLMIGISLLVVILCVFSIRFFWSRYDKYTREDGPVAGMITSAIVGCMFLLIATVNFLGLIQVLVAPRLYLIKQRARLIN